LLRHGVHDLPAQSPAVQHALGLTLGAGKLLLAVLLGDERLASGGGGGGGHTTGAGSALPSQRERQGGHRHHRRHGPRAEREVPALAHRALRLRPKGSGARTTSFAASEVAARQNESENNSAETSERELRCASILLPRMPNRRTAGRTIG